MKHYDFTGGVRGKTPDAKGTNLVLLDLTWQGAFPSAASVNEALRALAAIIRSRRDRCRRAEPP